MIGETIISDDICYPFASIEESVFMKVIIDIFFEIELLVKLGVVGYFESFTVLDSTLEDWDMVQDRLEECAFPSTIFSYESYPLPPMERYFPYIKKWILPSDKYIFAV